MDSGALETFLAVHRQGGVSAAAGALSRTQSAISRRLALLEQAAGAPLFERVGRGLVLSDLGRTLLPFAERVAAAVGDAQAAVAAARSGSAGTLRMVVVGTLANAALASALGRVRAAMPDLDLRLQTATSAEVSAQVRAGEASIGLRYFEDRSADLDCRVIQQEALVVACSPQHALAGRRVASLTRLAHERWLAFPVQPRRSESFASTIVAQFLTRGIDQVDWIAIDGLSAQKRLVQAGFGLALMQASAIEAELAQRELALIRVDDLAASMPVAWVVRRGGYQSGGLQALMTELLRGPSTRAAARRTSRGR